jgi:uncharacterized membrane protein YphA (DoxX/SURF4 family)
MRKLANITSYVLAAVFLLFGAMKFVNMEKSGLQFEGWGYPAWFGLVTGVVEIGTAVLLALPKTRFFGAGIGAVTMVVAAITHIMVPERGLLPLGIPMLVACLWLTWVLRPAGLFSQTPRPTPQ